MSNASRSSSFLSGWLLQKHSTFPSWPVLASPSVRSRSTRLADYMLYADAYQSERSIE